MLQPEYITISPDLHTAWVTLQVNNAIAVVDLRKAKVTRVLGLGLKDHAAPGNGFDASDRDGPGNAPRENIHNWKILGMYQPDAIAAYRSKGRDYLVTANEGDSREFEEARAGDLAATPGVKLPEYPGDILTSNSMLARLKVSKVDGFDPVSGTYGTLRSFGGRSFSIWTASARQVFDSGDAIECITAKVGKAADPVGPLFNTPDDEKSPDLRSDDRGPEPEGVAVGHYRGRTYAFIGLERQGGLMVYDVSDPRAPVFQQYINPRDARADPKALCQRGVPELPACAAVGDLGPEGVLFIPAFKSPTHRPLVVTANETSGSTRIYELIDGAE
jgi:hypothetical protein